METRLAACRRKCRRRKGGGRKLDTVDDPTIRSSSRDGDGREWRLEIHWDVRAERGVNNKPSEPRKNNWRSYGCHRCQGSEVILASEVTLESSRDIPSQATPN